MKIIPAIDILNGKCVRLSQGDYKESKIYNENPLEVALRFQDSGIRHLHLVDLDGAKANQIANAKVLETIAKNTNLLIDFGGGIKSKKDLEIAFQCWSYSSHYWKFSCEKSSFNGGIDRRIWFG
jgi:phosphoribosylformimino-5-aminoimidazole carboxamide ribotide isomerase